MKYLSASKLFTYVVAIIFWVSTSQTNAAIINFVTNGDFETGTLSSWTTSFTTSNGATGGWSAHDTTIFTAPLSTQALTLSVAGNGSYYALSDTSPSGFSTTALIQSFTVPLGTDMSKLRLKFAMFVNNWQSNTFQDNNGLDNTGNATNVFARVDILTSTATAFSTAPADVVINVLPPFADTVSDPHLFSSYNISLATLIPGTTYQLRFADTRNKPNPNDGSLNVGVGNVAIAIPEPSSMVIFGMGAFGMLFCAHRQRKTHLEDMENSQVNV